jgi:hypothetical protein
MHGVHDAADPGQMLIGSLKKKAYIGKNIYSRIDKKKYQIPTFEDCALA